MSAVIGLLIAIVLGMMALPSYMNLQNTASENIRVANAAGQLKKVADAAQGYIQNNYAVIQGTATATTPATITPAMLQSTGFLDASFQNANPYQQDYIVKVLQPTAGVLQALVLTQNGQAIPQKTAPTIATQVGGAEGGFVPYPGQYGTLTPTVAQGAYSAWQVSLANYGSPGAGHLAALLSFSNGQLQNNYLYRVAMPGNPSLNQMQTNLDMGNNNVNNAATVSATTVTASGNVNANQVQLNGVVSENTACSPNGLVARDANGLLLSCQSGVWHKSSISWTSAEGDTLHLQGSNGVSVHVENINGAFRLVNSPWTADIFNVDQNGNTSANDFYIRSIGKWASQLVGGVSGSLCGMDDMYNNSSLQNQTLCQGYDPFYNGCPAGYWRQLVGAVYNHYYYSCIKS